VALGGAKKKGGGTNLASASPRKIWEGNSLLTLSLHK
jgi:hypothetical protein